MASRSGTKCGMSVEHRTILPTRITNTLAADLVAADLVVRIISDGLTLCSAEVSNRRSVLRPGWGLVYVAEWRIVWRDALGSATITTIDRASDGPTAVSLAVELLSRTNNACTSD